MVFDDEAGAAAEQFNDNLDKLQTAGRGLGISIANDMLPGLNEVTRLMARPPNRVGFTAAIMAGLKFGVGDFVDNDQLSATYRLTKAQEQLNALRKDGFDEDHSRVKLLNSWIPKLQGLVDAEKKRRGIQARRKQGFQTDALGENRKEEQEAFKKSTNEQIRDAERLQSALQTAWDASIRAEEDYLRQAKKLRATAAGGGEIGDDPESQALGRLDAITALMKLQREAGTESLQNVQDQAEATRALVERLDDAAAKTDYLRQINLAEAAALEKAAAAEGARAVGLNAQRDESVRQAENLAGALENIGKEVSVEIKPVGWDEGNHRRPGENPAPAQCNQGRRAAQCLGQRARCVCRGRRPVHRRAQIREKIMAVPTLYIAGVGIAVEAFAIGQSYDAIGGSTVHRMLNGAGQKQQHWRKLVTTIRGDGWAPAALAGVDWSAAVEIKCMAPRAINSATVSATLPAARRSDFADAVLARAVVDGRLVSTPVSVIVNAATATAVSGATSYQFMYYPQFSALSNGPSDDLDMERGIYGWSLTAEEV